MFSKHSEPKDQTDVSGESKRPGQFAKRVLLTISGHMLVLVLGIATSIILARLLGPEGKGIYTLVTLLPTLIVTFASLGIGTATAYYVAKGHYPRREILGNNILLAFGIGAIGVLGGLIVALFFHHNLFPGVAQSYLLFALALIPTGLFFVYLQGIFLGAQRFKEYNLIIVVQAFLFLVFIVVALWALNAWVRGAIVAGVLAWFLTNVVLLLWAWKVAGGISFKLNPAYLKKTSSYGIQVHLAIILGFLNSRIDLFLINGFLYPAAVGFYFIAVGLVEQLRLVIANAASIVLFPKVATETDEQRRKQFTPLVARTVLWITALGALALFFLSHWIIIFMYSEIFLPAVRPLQILLPGIVALGVAEILAHDISGRGRPMLNNYIGGISLVVNVALNLLWIPRYGIEGAALASAVSYSVSLVGQLILYCRLSGNSWIQVLVPKQTDWTVYQATGLTLVKELNERARALFLRVAKNNK